MHKHAYRADMLACRLLPPVPSLLALLAGIVLAGCAGARGTYPSLAHRPIEDRAIGGVEDGKAPPLLTPVTDSALDQEAATQLAAAEGSVTPFQALLQATRSAIAAAKGAAPGEERWVVAQEAVSRLDQARSPANIAAAALDKLRVDAANRVPPVDTGRLDAALARASAIQAEQEKAFRPIADALPTG